jgi:hypothetical protein
VVTGGLLASADSMALSKDRLYIEPGDMVPFIMLRLPFGERVL